MRERATAWDRRCLLLAGALLPLAACAGEPEPLERSSSDPAPAGPGSGSGSPPGSPAPGGRTSSDPTGSGTSGTLEQVDLPRVVELAGRWAAYAAIWAGGEFSSGGGPSADDGDWLYEDMFGQWAFLTRFADGRAVMVGSARPGEVRPAADEASAREAMLSGAPAWWETGLQQIDPATTIHFVCGYEDGRWREVSGASDRAGGIGSLNFVLRTERQVVDEMVLMANTGVADRPARAKAAARALVRAGSTATAAQVDAVGPDIRDARAGAAAAALFAAPGRH
ncbi:hypothetical protein AWH69_03745 [Janibacter melonis]|uniref:Lipocalin-like domain-containing protein n=1 Tax=Janibacter melonis TaxID=262209 RepID=A0A176QGV1_9MICO|nr:hypothetical protein [Janibacter melonis]OAB88891.1 hypothetical protein AWH69_03745 [Janibacter melonis]